MNPILEKIMTTLGLEKEDQLEAKIASLMSAAGLVDDLNTQITDLTAQNGELTQTVADLNVQIESDKDHVAMGKKYIKQLKQEIRGMVGTVMGNLSESMQELIESAGPEKLESLRTEFEERAATMYPAKCQDCGSLNVSTRSSQETTSLKQNLEIDQQKYSLRDLKK